MPHVTFRVDHLSRGPRWSYWWTLTCLQNHWIGLACSLWMIAEIRSKWLDKQENCVLGSMYFQGLDAVTGDGDISVLGVVF